MPMVSKLLSRSAALRALAVGLLVLAMMALMVSDGLWGAVLGFAAVAVGLSVRIFRVDRPALLRAEALWASQGPASEVSALLAPAVLARGELGYRIHVLRSRVHLALGYRDRAWLDGLQAQLDRLPLWRRFLVGRYFNRVPEHPSQAHLKRGARLVRLAPYMGRLRHLLGILELRTGDASSSQRAWVRFAEALPLSLEDPLLLEDLMLAAFSQGMPELGERAFHTLLHHHGDPRIPWDRAAAAFHLLREERFPEVLSLLLPLSHEQRTQPMHWLALSVAQRTLGHRDAAWETIEEGVRRHPEAFRLWMERYLVALDRRDESEALESLQKAHPLPAAGKDGETQRQEWRLRRAEFAYWCDGDAETAWAELEGLPDEALGDHHPPLRLQLRVARGEYEIALEEVQALLKAHPQDPPLLLLQADCMAGLEAWEALLDYLAGLGEGCREYPQFWHLRGLSLAHLKDPLMARQDLERAARMEPQRIRFLMDAGHACAELGEWDRAEAHWRQALTVDPQDEEALIHLSEARQELADPDGAKRYLRECLIHHPDSADAQDRLAELEAN
jgi:tetratricopeptide (TPR) repeat protein